MKVRYQIIIEVTADGMMGPLRVLNLVRYALNQHLSLEVSFGNARLAAVYPVAHAVEEGVDHRVQGSDTEGPSTPCIIPDRPPHHGGLG